ncbi:MAG TPA: OsmC family protein [Terriglobia bacterium]|nr:OsmC family protein [Terriglobia bacterium]
MENKKAFKTFRYKNDLAWKSPHRGVLSQAGKPQVIVGSPPEFRGYPDNWSPEDLLVGALNTCLMLTFYALAHTKGVEPISYQSTADGLLENVDGVYRITEVEVTPTVVLKSEADSEIARDLMANKVEANCFITNSISGKVKLNPQFQVNPPKTQ